MTEPILNPRYWGLRLKRASERHQAIFRCPIDRWKRIEEKHKKILAETIHCQDSILDAGCGWGRLLELLPENWEGTYLGIDIAPDFIDLALGQYNYHSFIVGDLRSLPNWISDKFYGWAILISMRPMVIRNLGQGQWDKMESEIRRVSRKLLYLEYDENDNGSIE